MIYLFDLDGTLVNTEDIFHKKLEHLYHFDKELINGASYEFIAKQLNMTVEHLDYLFFHCLFDCEPINNSIDFIKDCCKRNVRMGIVSSSYRKHIEIVLEKFDILDCFEIIIGAEDVERNKPEPDCYLLAMKKMNCYPEEVTVYEDSIHGIKAAESAGITNINKVSKDFIF